MNYEQFKTEYTKALNSMVSYRPDQVGSSHFADKLADLSDAYPEFESVLLDDEDYGDGDLTKCACVTGCEPD